MQDVRRYCPRVRNGQAGEQNKVSCSRMASPLGFPELTCRSSFIFSLRRSFFPHQPPPLLSLLTDDHLEVNLSNIEMLFVPDCASLHKSSLSPLTQTRLLCSHPVSNRCDRHMHLCSHPYLVADKGT